jgi:tetratricopeptide (TPR) repeat protein
MKILSTACGLVAGVVASLVAEHPAAADDMAIKQDFVLCGMQQDSRACDRLVATPGLSNTVRANAYGTRAGVWLHMGRIEAAKADLEQALKLDPGNTVAQRGLAMLKQVSPNDQRVVLAACTREIDLDAKLKACNTLVASGARDDTGKAAAFELRARAFLDAKRFDEALADLDAADRLAPQRQDAALHRVQTLTEAGRFPAGLQAVRAALAKSGGANPDLLHAEANLLYLSGEREAAVTAYDKLYSVAPQAVMTKFWSAIIRQELRKDSTDDLRALLGDPMMSPLGAAIIRLRLQEGSEADVLKEAQVSGPTAPCIAYFNIGHDAWIRGNAPAAKLAFQKAVETGSSQLAEYQAAKLILAQLPAE